MKRDDHTNEEIAQLYALKLANTSATATALNIYRSTLIRWRESDTELDQMMKDVEESMIDFTESKLYERINEGDTSAIIFYLKTKGKKRGYVEKTQQEVNITGEPTVKIRDLADRYKELRKEYLD